MQQFIWFLLVCNISVYRCLWNKQSIPSSYTNPLDSYSSETAHKPTKRNERRNTLFLVYIFHINSHCKSHWSNISPIQVDIPLPIPFRRNTVLGALSKLSHPPLSFPRQHIHFLANEESHYCRHGHILIDQISVVLKLDHRKTRCNHFELLHPCTIIRWL